MSINSSKAMFYSTMMMGIMLSISSNNWIMIWCGLEISLVSIIPLMINNMAISSESTMKYFIVQSISSAMLMLSMMTMIMSGDYNYGYILMTALLMKTGVAPFHNWLLTVVEGVSLNMMLIMLTINKIAPITLLSYNCQSLTMITMITVTASAIMGLNQNSIKKLIGYSSIFNMGFLIAVLKNNWMWMYYLLIYSMLTFMLVVMMSLKKIKFVNQMIFMQLLNDKLVLWLIMLSMGGMPPLMGFSIKYMVMLDMILNKTILLMVIMLMTSLIVMFFYLRMTFVSIMNNSTMVKNKLFVLNEISSSMIILNTSMLPMMMYVKTLM
nr:NADH dehydrogenase subunit 2 [Eurhadina acapitata]